MKNLKTTFIRHRRFVFSSMRHLLTLFALALLSQSSFANISRALQDIDFVTLPGERVVITLTLSEAAPKPVVFTVDKPARISLDLPATRSAVAERFKRINVGKTRSVATAEANGRTRVVVELAEQVAHSIKVNGNQVMIELDSAGRSAGTVTEADPVTGELKQVSSSFGKSIQSIDFRRGERGEGRIVVKLNDPEVQVDVREEGGVITAEFKNVSAANELLRRLDVIDFATPVKYIDTVSVGVNTHLMITPLSSADFEQVAYQSNDVFTLELQPLTEEQVEQQLSADPVYTGERLSLSFQNVDIRSVLQIIADVAGTNMVVSDQVTGDIALRLQNVPWDQALNIILRSKGLGMRQEGNVMMVAPQEKIAAQEKAELEAAEAKQNLAPLRSELIQVNYAKAEALAAMIKSKDSSIISERGSVNVDERTNTLIVLETREKLADIRTLVKKLDIPVRQVLIESRIVVANADFSREIGSRFGTSYVGSNGSDGLTTVGGSLENTDGRVQDFLANGFPVETGGLGDRLNFNVPIAAGTGKLALAVLGSDYLVDLEISALQAEGRGELVSSPRVVTANAKEASIEQGVEIPFQQSAESGASTIAFKKAVLALRVTPQITPDERIIMDLEVRNDSVGQVVSDVGGGNVPSIDTRRVQTQVLIDDGETVVLGGIYEQTSTDSKTKIPFLGDIPLLGRFFRSEGTSTRKRELLIFVTPRVLSDGLNAR